jgi:hypothetical protein
VSLIIGSVEVRPGEWFTGLDPAVVEFPVGTVYCVHMLRPYVAVSRDQQKWFQHYIGHAEPGMLVIRQKQHGTRQGARVLLVAQAAGIDWVLARVWPGGYARERQVKLGGAASRFCTACGVRPRDTRPGEAKL